VRVGRKRVARLLRLTGRRGISHRHKRRDRRPDPAVHQDLVQRTFTAVGPDLFWCTDITEHPTRAGKVYCAAVLDVFTRQVVGWSIADHIRSELVVDALQMAIWRRRPEPGPSFTRTGAASTRPGSSGTDSATPACSDPWAESPHRWTTG
jgi:transposase InsO family protein